MKTSMLRLVDAADLRPATRKPVDATALATASEILEDVRDRGEAAVREHAERLGDRQPGEPLILGVEELQRSLRTLDEADRTLLERTADRIRRFAEAQRECLLPLETEVPGGRAGHRWLPVSGAGAYAPGGRYPLPSSVLMTVIPARVAGVESVVVASPRPNTLVCAAAAVAGADSLLAIGGAQAIGALAFGTLTERADVVVGPGNRFVTAAKQLLVGEVGIDGLAGPSELVVLADEEACPRTIAADLLGQAEHDADAVPILISTSRSVVASVQEELLRQLETLPTAETASTALDHNGRAVVVDDLEAAARLSDALAPEHLQLLVSDPGPLVNRLRNYGGLFVGSKSAEVFGDYGLGPNHVLPTGGGARFQAGLSVATFLRASTWLEIDDASLVTDEVSRFARLEGLEAHARAAEQRHF